MSNQVSSGLKTPVASAGGNQGVDTTQGKASKPTIMDGVHARIDALEAFVHRLAHAVVETDKAVADGVKLTIKEIHDAYVADNTPQANAPAQE